MSAAPWAGDPAVDAALAEMEAWCGYTEISASKELWNEWTAALNKFGAAVYAHALKSKREAVPVASEPTEQQHALRSKWIAQVCFFLADMTNNVGTRQEWQDKATELLSVGNLTAPSEQEKA